MWCWSRICVVFIAFSSVVSLIVSIRIAVAGTPDAIAWRFITCALLGPLLSAAAPENTIYLAQPLRYNLIASSARASVSPPLTATIASADLHTSKVVGACPQPRKSSTYRYAPILQIITAISTTIALTAITTFFIAASSLAQLGLPR